MELKGLGEPPKEEIVTSESGGQKGQKLERYALIPVIPLAEIARVYGYGANKYSPNNWRKGYEWSLSKDALDRHIESFWGGQSIDPESGRHHLAHAAFHLLTLMEYELRNLGVDDRVPYEEKQ